MEHKDNLFTYLKWRGDLTLQQDPLNEIDGLIFSELSYLRFEGIVPMVGQEGAISIAETARRYRRGRRRELYLNEKEALLHTLAQADRYKDMTLCNYVSTTDVAGQQQFAALHINVAPNQTFIAFRGTDSTVVGWKEDANMSYMMPVPAQKSAVEYVEKTARGIFRKYYLGGHSKGGNLAIYSAVFVNAKLQRKLEAVFSYDGPGFNRTIVKDESYLAVRERIHAYVPEESVIGLLMEHEEDYSIVRCDANLIQQHEGFFWKVDGNHFDLAEELSTRSQDIRGGIRSFLSKVNSEERKALVDAFFLVFEKAGVEDFLDLQEIDAKTAALLLRAATSVSKETRDLVGKITKLLVEERKKK